MHYSSIRILYMFRIRNKTFHFQYKSTYASEKSLGKKSHNGFMKFSHNPHNEHPHEKGEREKIYCQK
jgi:hypothetical protein